ncbi:hypothetical protein BCV70DRAFT_26273 [Testicularia cyperi]|uniref:Uncharacterized protein n=1 Tax=Testicularia cyperi TaxID=1882483 RepID=A0A317XK95_9BASI|nr:hypothetical protein BCV70DRAFT_26273 [Testicularia cyperi]
MTRCFILSLRASCVGGQRTLVSLHRVFGVVGTAPQRAFSLALVSRSQVGPPPPPRSSCPRPSTPDTSYRRPPAAAVSPVSSSGWLALICCFLPTLLAGLFRLTSGFACVRACVYVSLSFPRRPPQPIGPLVVLHHRSHSLLAHSPRLLFRNTASLLLPSFVAFFGPLLFPLHQLSPLPPPTTPFHQSAHSDLLVFGIVVRSCLIGFHYFRVQHPSLHRSLSTT